MDIEKLSVRELVKLLSPNSEVQKELRNRGVLRTKNIVGDIGEYFVKEFFQTTSLTNLSLAEPGTKNVDLFGRNGKRYSVKTVSSGNTTTGSFHEIKENDKVFDYLLIVILDEDYNLSEVLQLDWDEFIEYMNYNKRTDSHSISVSNKLRKSVTTLYPSEQTPSSGT